MRASDHDLQRGLDAQPGCRNAAAIRAATEDLEDFMPRRRSMFAVTLALAVTIVVTGWTGTSGSLRAQELPGLIVSVPPDTPAPTAPPQRQPKVASTAPESAPPRAKKPRRRTKARSTRRRTVRRPPKRRSAGRPRPSSSKAGTSIVVLVNDDPITAYEVEQRARLMALGADIRGAAQANFKALIKRPGTNQRLKAILQQTIAENRGKSRDHIIAVFERRKRAFALGLQKQAIASARAGAFPAYRKKALQELIEERLKLQEAKRLKIAPTKKDLERAITTIAKRNKADAKTFAERITKLGIDFATMRDRIRAQIAWSNVVQTQFSRFISINQLDIDRELAASTNKPDGITLNLHRITLTLPSKVTQASIAQRIAQAEELQRRFRGCVSTRKLVGSVPGARFEDLGARKADTIAEPTRTLLLNAKDGDMVPPNTTTRGIELYAVCGRSAAKGSLKERDQARASIRQKEFEILGRRRLLDLKRDAHLEYR
ncbi:MAG: SurA N-terminal domain-containing protein [Hyphomicrobiaceae bacterium]|nr:SurA N-terminal domain-containing protein [Hyphomicrobiaceae bacterium]